MKSHTKKSLTQKSLTQKCIAISIVAALSTAAMAANSGVIEPAMQFIPGGQFMMGTDAEVLAGRPQDLKPMTSASPAHKVSIKPFRMGKYEVTVKEFAQFVAATNYVAPKTCLQMASKEWFDDIAGNWAGNKHSSSEFEPVTCIGWTGAKAYTAWLSSVTGKTYRLPTEAEWEYAALAGQNTIFLWGNEADRARACGHANIADQAAEAAIKRDYDGLESKDHVGVLACNDQSGYASVVGMYQANAWGLHDLIGNINEFVEDCYTKGYSNAPADGSARLDGDCATRALRGGSWHWPVQPTIQRGSMPADFIGALEGFRVVEELTAGSPEATVIAPANQKAVAEFAQALQTAQTQARTLRAQK